MTGRSPRNQRWLPYIRLEKSVSWSAIFFTLPRDWYTTKELIRMVFITCANLYKIFVKPYVIISSVTKVGSFKNVKFKMLEVPTTDADWLFVIGLIFKFSKIIIIIIINYNKSNNNSNNNDNNNRLTAWEHVRLIVKRQSRMRWGEGEQ